MFEQCLYLSQFFELLFKLLNFFCLNEILFYFKLSTLLWNTHSPQVGISTFSFAEKAEKGNFTVQMGVSRRSCRSKTRDIKKNAKKNETELV